MAVIPQARARRSLDTGRGTQPSIRISDAPGRALQRVGASLNAFAERAQQQQEEMAAFKASTGLVDFQGEADKLLRDAQNNLVPGAEGFHDGVVGQFDEMATNFTGSITDPKTKQKAELAVQRVRNKFSSDAAKTEFEERKRFFGVELNRIGEGFLTRVDENPASIGASIDEFTETVETSGLPPIEKHEKIQAFKELAVERALQSLGQDNPELAKRVMNQIRRLQAQRFGGKDRGSADINASLPDTLINTKERFTPGKGKLARGLRNNNPGNIEFGKFTKSKGAVGSDGRFAKFESPEQGIAAMAALLRSYQNRGLNTINKMISRYAPSSENNTKAYVNAVARAVGVGPDQPFSVVGRPDLTSRMVAAMILHENAKQPYSVNQITEGVSAGLGGEPVGDAKRVGSQKVRGTRVAVATPPVVVVTDVPNQVDPKVVKFTKISGQNQITQEDAPEGETLLSGERITLDPEISSGETALKDLDEATLEAILQQAARLPKVDEIPQAEVNERSITEPEDFLDDALEAAVQTPEVDLPEEAQPILQAAARGQVVIGAKSFARVNSVIGTSQKARNDAEDDAAKDLGDSVFKDLLSLSARGQLTVEQIEANKNVLSAAHFSQLLKAASGTAAKSDLAVYADLLRRAADEPEQVQQDALQALSEGLLTKEDFSQLFGITRSEDRRVPRWHADIKRFVRDSLQPGEFDIGTKQTRIQNNAAIEIVEFLNNNPEATFEEAQSAAKDLVFSSLLSAGKAGELTPTFLEGDLSIPNLQLAKQKTFQAFNNGEISEAEAIRQGKLIRELLEQEQKKLRIQRSQ